MIAPEIRTALCAVPLGGSCCRRAELATMVQLRGRVHVAGGGVVLVAELPTAAAAERLGAVLRGLAPEAQVLLVHNPPVGSTTRPGGHRGRGQERVTTPIWTVLVRPAEHLARHSGLLNDHNQALVGLPARVLHGPMCCAAAVWRAALLASPVGLTGLEVACPTPAIGHALVGLARRLGARASVQTRHGLDYTHITNPTRLLTAVGAPSPTPAITALPLHVLNTGSQAQQVDDRIFVAPVDELWAGAPAG